MAASAGKQLHNRMQNHTCLQRRAGVRARGGNSGYGQPKGGQHHRQPDDLRARFKVTKLRAFCHTDSLRNRHVRLKLVLSDSAALICLTAPNNPLLMITSTFLCDI